MLRNLLATTAVAALIATGGAYAQTTTTQAPAAAPAETAPAEPAAPVERADGYLASNIIGETVYNGTSDDAQNIGSVQDVVMTKDGAAESVIVGVGGFLGLGAKAVAIPFDKIDWAEKDGDRWIVVSSTKEELQALPEFDTAPYEPAPAVASTEPAAGTTGMAPAAPSTGSGMAAAPDTTTQDSAANDNMSADDASKDKAAQAPAASGDTTAQAPAASTDTTQTAAIDKSTLTKVAPGDIRTDDLVGTTVYGSDDANVGEIGDIVMTQDGKIDAIIIDVGGFLGVGEKEVAVGMDNLAFMSDKDGNNYLYTNLTKDQLDAAAAYDESTWADKRDEQRITVQ
jgi:sporulation protein YlmC with PRC-barrel domain